MSQPAKHEQTHQETPHSSSSSIPGPELLGRKVSIEREVQRFPHSPAQPQGQQQPKDQIPGIRVNPGKESEQAEVSSSRASSGDVSVAEPMRGHVSHPYEGQGVGTREFLYAEKDQSAMKPAEGPQTEKPQAGGFLEYVSEEDIANEKDPEKRERLRKLRSHQESQAEAGEKSQRPQTPQDPQARFQSSHEQPKSQGSGLSSAGMPSLSASSIAQTLKDVAGTFSKSEEKTGKTEKTKGQQK